MLSWRSQIGHWILILKVKTRRVGEREQFFLFSVNGVMSDADPDG